MCVWVGPRYIIKLLANLKPDKAAGPDSIKTNVLKEVRLEIALFICLLFEKSPQSRLDKSSSLSPFLKRAIKLTLPFIGLSP